MHCIDKLEQESSVRIHECVLVGDGGQIPAVVALFEMYFNLKHEHSGGHLVSRGCALSAAIDLDLIQSPVSLELVPHSIRMGLIEENSDANMVMIAAQSPCPCKKTVQRYVQEETTYRMCFYEGESSNNAQCQLIGRFEVRNIERRAKTKLVIAVHVDRNGIMMVSAEDVTAKPPVSLTVVKLSH